MPQVDIFIDYQLPLSPTHMQSSIRDLCNSQFISRVPAYQIVNHQSIMGTSKIAECCNIIAGGEYDSAISVVVVSQGLRVRAVLTNNAKHENTKFDRLTLHVRLRTCSPFTPNCSFVQSLHSIG